MVRAYLWRAGGDSFDSELMDGLESLECWLLFILFVDSTGEKYLLEQDGIQLFGNTCWGSWAK